MTTRDLGSEKTYRSGSEGRNPVRSGSESSAPLRMNPSHEQIAARARAIWESKGCPAGRDQENWREAEEQLRRGSPRS